jgi:hypothetical protein
VVRSRERGTDDRTDIAADRLSYVAAVRVTSRGVSRTYRADGNDRLLCSRSAGLRQEEVYRVLGSGE